jgi:FKBP-type peptidyl-prolyl cis-trans isomerase SlyD
MKISNNIAASVSYKIQINNNSGELIEFADDKNPKLLIFGNNSIIPGFETHMAGMEAGDNFEFTLNPEESFGTYRQDLIVDVPKSSFEINGILKEDLIYLGNEISMLDNGGNTVLGTVIEITDNVVKMDYNHKLADKQLFVSGKIHEVRSVTEDDLAPAGGCGSGCGCSSKDTQPETCCSSNEVHEHANADDCPTCGNPAELRGQGHGNCGCS